MNEPDLSSTGLLRRDRRGGIAGCRASLHTGQSQISTARPRLPWMPRSLRR